jgi:hypothetical protein
MTSPRFADYGHFKCMCCFMIENSIAKEDRTLFCIQLPFIFPKHNYPLLFRKSRIIWDRILLLNSRSYRCQNCDFLGYAKIKTPHNRFDDIEFFGIKINTVNSKAEHTGSLLKSIVLPTFIVENNYSYNLNAFQSMLQFELFYRITVK